MKPGKTASGPSSRSRSLWKGEASAALNIYSTQTHAFSGDDIGIAEAYANQASKALRLAVRSAKLTDDRNNLTAAMESRTTIDLALGIIMAQNRCSQATAFKIPRIAANTRNAKLREVAASVLRTVLREPRRAHPLRILKSEPRRFRPPGMRRAPVDVWMDGITRGVATPPLAGASAGLFSWVQTPAGGPRIVSAPGFVRPFQGSGRAAG